MMQNYISQQQKLLYNFRKGLYNLHFIQRFAMIDACFLKPICCHSGYSFKLTAQMCNTAVSHFPGYF